jgi:hypothetical protein
MAQSAIGRVRTRVAARVVPFKILFNRDCRCLHRVELGDDQVVDVEMMSSDGRRIIIGGDETLQNGRENSDDGQAFGHIFGCGLHTYQSVVGLLRMASRVGPRFAFCVGKCFLLLLIVSYSLGPSGQFSSIAAFLVSTRNPNNFVCSILEMRGCGNGW